MLESFNRHAGHMAITAITLSELLHGVEKRAAMTATRSSVPKMNSMRSRCFAATREHMYDSKFLSQIFAYANTGLERQAIFCKALLPLLEFEREINTVDLSKVVLTHNHLRNLGTKKLDLTPGDGLPIPSLAPGGAGVQDKDNVELAEIIAKQNDLFSDELSDSDKWPYVCSMIRGKLMESSPPATAGGGQQQGAVFDLTESEQRTARCEHRHCSMRASALAMLIN